MIPYLLKMVLCSGLLVMAYFLLLEKEKMHGFNRFYLLFSLAFSLVVPLISFETHQSKLPFTEKIYISDNAQLPLNEVISFTPTVKEKNRFSFNTLLAAYIFITAFFFIRFVRNLSKLLGAVQSNQSINYKGAKLILATTGEIPYSFLHYIFLKRENYGLIEKEILHHELTHVRQQHSLDILFVELLLIVAWFNPFFWIYRKAIQMNHEYLADDAVIHKFGDTKKYQHLLLNTAAYNTSFTLSSSFNYLTTKKRMTMMLKTTSPMAIIFRQSITLMFLGCLVLLFSTKIIAQSLPKQTPTLAHKPAEKDTTKLPPWVGVSIGFTKDGVTEDLLNEYQSLVDKYFLTKGSQFKKLNSVSEPDRARMEDIFKQMNPEQQSKQLVAFLKPPKPLPRVTPTPEQFNNFKNATVYGVWINEKKVSNTILNNYANTDFTQVFISKLYGAAKKGRTYTHQVDLMTTDYYKNYVEQTLQNNRSSMVFRSPKKTQIEF